MFFSGNRGVRRLKGWIYLNLFAFIFSFIYFFNHFLLGEGSLSDFSRMKLQWWKRKKKVRKEISSQNNSFVFELAILFFLFIHLSFLSFYLFFFFFVHISEDRQRRKGIWNIMTRKEDPPTNNNWWEWRTAGALNVVWDMKKSLVVNKQWNR